MMNQDREKQGKITAEELRGFGFTENEIPLGIQIIMGAEKLLLHFSL